MEDDLGFEPINVAPTTEQTAQEADDLGFEASSNTPDTPIDQVPEKVGILERMRLATGNTRGNIKRLKSMFDDVAYSPKTGITVKENGTWKKIDKSSYDPYEVAADIAEGAVSLSPSLIGGTAGAIGGAAVSGPAGAIAGSAAGAGIAEAMRGELGKALGTYEATPEEQLKDIGLEMLYNAGGEAIALGARPLLSGLVKAAKNLPETSIKALAKVSGSLTGAGEEATEHMLRNSERIGKGITSAIKEHGGAEAVKDAMANKNLKLMNVFLDKASKELPKKYGQLMSEMGSVADEVGFNANFKQLYSNIAQQLNESGLATAGAKEGTLKPFTDIESFARLLQGKEGKLLEKTSRGELVSIFNHLSTLSKQTSGKGKSAVTSLMELRRTINASISKINQNTTDQTVKAFANKAGDIVKGSIDDLFLNSAMKDKFLASKQLYMTYGDSVKWARNLVSSGDRGIETFMNKLTSPSGRNASAKNAVDSLTELLGSEGQVIKGAIADNNTISRFASVLPKATLSSLTGGSMAGYAFGHGVIGAPVLAAGAMAASPRATARVAQGAGATGAAAAKAYQYAKPAVDLIRKMTPEMRLQWLKNPQLIDATFRTAFESYQQEDQQTEELLKQSGVVK